MPQSFTEAVVHVFTWKHFTVIKLLPFMMSLKIIVSKLLQHLPGANELKQHFYIQPNHPRFHYDQVSAFNHMPE